MHRLHLCRGALRCKLYHKNSLSRRSFRALSKTTHQNATTTTTITAHHLRFNPHPPTHQHPKRTFHNATTTPEDTIYALSTAPGRAAIAIIRISGPACLPIYTALCPNRPPPKPRTATLRRLTHPTNPSEVLDTALLLYLPAPHTATGEDILELHVHGGPAIVRGVLDAIPRCAATKADLDTAGKDAHGYGHGRGHTTRPATPGEFTKRAFYNNILDLTEVEALGETLAAETEQQRRLALSGSSSTLTTRYEHWRSLLLYARGELEALIDFSEDQHFDESPSQLLSGTATQVAELVSQIKLHVLNAGRGELLRSGIVVALLGAPNAGKSSLLNRVVGREAAIVSGEEGTTRDIVDVSVDLGGWLVRLGDMAGVRAGLQPTGATEQTRDVNGSVSAVGEIEQEGIRRARERALQSDLVIVLISLRPTATGTVSLDLNDELLSAVRECRLAGKEMLFALNKIDLLHAQTASTKTSLSRLLSQLIQTFPETDANDVFCLSCRDADSSNADEPDAGGLQTFMAGLTRKFSAMTSAAAGLDGTQTNVSMSPAEAQSYWTASLSVTHRQSQYLRECLVHLEDFLETSGHAIAPSVKEEQELETETVLSTQHSHDSAASKSGFFDTEDTSSPSMSHKPQDARYHIDNHDDSVGEREHNAPQVLTSPSNGTTIPYSWADTSNNTADMEEIDIVTAAEHLRAAADCLAKLTGRGDGVSSGADVEDVLGVVFEK